MKRLLVFLVVVALLGVGAWLALPRLAAWWQVRNRPKFREREVVRGDIAAVVNATGTVQPVLKVSVGSFVSGPVTELKADYNDEVKHGQLLAQIDTRIYSANVLRDEAALATREADVDRIQAMLAQARNDYRRAQALRAENPGYISEAELDRVLSTLRSYEAELKVAHAAVKQARANLDLSTANLGYTKITSPVDGTVIERKIDEGQTLAASFQTPEMFIVAPKMREEMHVFASVDEADIGLILAAQERGEKVEFTVDAYPDDLFLGKVKQVRINPTTTQNVVTYPVVVSVANPELKLLPGMTASISFQIERREKVLRIPNAALRFYPAREQVRPQDQKILEGVEETAADATEQEEQQEAVVEPSAAEKIEASRRRDRRHVWIVEEGLLRAVEVITGISDNKYTELVRGDLEEGQKLVTGVERPGTGG